MVLRAHLPTPLAGFEGQGGQMVVALQVGAAGIGSAGGMLAAVAAGVTFSTGSLFLKLLALACLMASFLLCFPSAMDAFLRMFDLVDLERMLMLLVMMLVVLVLLPMHGWMRCRTREENIFYCMYLN